MIISENQSNWFYQVKFMMSTTCFLILVFQVFSFCWSFGMLSQNLNCSLVWGRRADTQSFTVFSTSDKFMHRRVSSKYKSSFYYLCQHQTILIIPCNLTSTAALINNLIQFLTCLYSTAINICMGLINKVDMVCLSPVGYGV